MGFGKDGQGQILHDTVILALGALAAGDTISAITKIDGTRSQGFRILKTEVMISHKGLGGGEGPVVVGLALNNNAAEIEEALEADPQGPQDVPAAEQTTRPVWPLAMITQTDLGQVNNGMPIDKNLRWSFSEAQAMSVWGFNVDDSVLTTGGQVIFSMKHFGVWLRD